MSSFEPRAAGSIVARPDPTKHVNYNLGMVLGVDDFTQEFAYISGRDQWMARDLLGYGTACGLRVTIEKEGAGGPQVVVTPGAAVSPRGQLIRVKPTQCADLNEWLKLDKNKPKLDDVADSEKPLSLYVVLCYRECRTDQVPIPGEPCRSEEESMAASRVADDFSLELRFDAPDQREEDALRDFIAWLSQIETDTTGDLYTREQFEEAIREAAHLLTSPPASPLDYMFGSPPASLRIPVNDACEFLRAALRIWVTELRPIWLARGETASGQLSNEECVLLAELSLPILKVGTEWAVDDSREAQVSEDRRPFLIHLRMLQEWIECGRRERYPADSVKSEELFGQMPDAGHSLAYSRADHTHGTPAMQGDVTVDWENRTFVKRLSNIPIIIPTAGEDALADGQVLTYVAATGDGGTQSKADGDQSKPGGGGGSGSIEDSSGRPTGDNTESASQGKESPDAPAASIKDLREDPSELRPSDSGYWRPSYLKIQGMPVSHDTNQLVLPNQVLTYVEEGEPGNGTWRALDTQHNNTANMSGDVTGISYYNTVSKIRNVPVNFEERPKDGQVLAFVESEDGTDLRIEPRDVEDSGAVTLAGDVIGQPTATSVVKIRGTDVAAVTPLDNQVLTFFGGVWRPRAALTSSGPAPSNTVEIETAFGMPSKAGASNSYSRADHTHGTPPLPTMDGDVQGRLDSTFVRGILGLQILSSGTHAFKDGAVLTFRRQLGRESWTVEEPKQGTGGGFPDSAVSRTAPDKAPTMAVQHPDAGPYSIVAAGIIKGDGSVRGGTGYNGLGANVTGPGRLTIFFNGYENPETEPAPDRPFFYIVKALPVINLNAEAQPKMLSVFFEKYQQESLVLRVTDQGDFVDQNTLTQMELMLEISRYEMPAEVDTERVKGEAI